MDFSSNCIYWICSFHVTCNKIYKCNAYIRWLLAIVASIIVNFTFTFYLLSLINKDYKDKEKIEVAIDFQKALTRMLFVLLPLIIMTVILCFANWLPLYSFGMVMFWGIITLLIYNIVITRTLIVNAVKD